MSHRASCDIYGNYQVLNLNDQLIFRCDEKKFNWYLRKGLAEQIDDKTIKLTFIPGGPGIKDCPSLLPERKNVCVVCGSIEKLNRHHVVPYCYRRYFPDWYKNHNHYDVLAICTDCHDRYEAEFASRKKRDLGLRYKAPIHGVGISQESLVKSRACRSAHAIRLHRDKMPHWRMESHLSIIRAYLGNEPTDGDIISLSDEGISRYCKGPYYRSHGEVVASGVSNIAAFVKEWRTHFVESMDPKYLPEGWSIDGWHFEESHGKENIAV